MGPSTPVCWIELRQCPLWSVWHCATCGSTSPGGVSHMVPALQHQGLNGKKPGTTGAWLLLQEQAAVSGFFPQWCWGFSATAFSQVLGSQSGESPNSITGRSLVSQVLGCCCCRSRLQCWACSHSVTGLPALQLLLRHFTASTDPPSPIPARIRAKSVGQKTQVFGLDLGSGPYVCRS